VKSPISMTNGRFNSSKCRGMLPKKGVLYTHSPKSLGPFPKILKKKFKKMWTTRQGEGRPTVGGPRPPGDQRSLASRGSTPGPIELSPFFLNFFFFLHFIFCTSGQLLLVGSSTCPPCPNFS
jgi:hypothetical protein